MAQIVGVFQTAHTPFCYRRPEDWNEARSARSLRADVPVDDLESNRRKYERVQNGFAVLRRKLAEAGPDVIVVFGDDQPKSVLQLGVGVGDLLDGGRGHGQGDDDAHRDGSPKCTHGTSQ